ncbi:MULTISPECIES: ABC transporter permease [Bacillales]|jgi:simple sugar transport system permease protein|uniref:Sugar ABC transporter permease n=1 Tax=Brevibacillus aydinogluensis TaxID=927786 RepID=A0AA48M9M2_9BACL|nr:MULTISPECIES: ABC transporter permease [Bacillales]REK65132.1 MAG: sugar ABC transporter permease [Brevibacillus sp.]MBR8658678.1 ABC transporter permease [Brevibacillus sp. NL20B1]MDT3415997.1 simple sugar transport system permease protein [Brevibacillus aydinogluensis]NNV03082.1 ABC transporter permease [Brevibacillus sp. MCWH]UFJ61545.1 ABC transporter permease [Anoxybacillus sediminis]
MEAVLQGEKTKQTRGSLAQRYGALLAILAVIVFFSIVNENFLSYANLVDILRSISIVTLVAIGVTFSLIVGGFDLSVGSTVSVATVLSASLMVWYRQELLVAVVVPLLAGLVIGLINALLVVKVRIPDILATLVSLYVFQGIHLSYTQGFSIYNNMPMADGSSAPGIIIPSFLFIGQGEIWGIPVPVILMALAVVGVHVFLNYTRFGRMLYVTGGNLEAARLSGVPVNKYRTLAYMLSALFASIGGIVLTARIGTGQVMAGSPLLMDAVAAAFIGFSIFGQGKPNAFGTFCGAILMGVLMNGLTMMNVPYYAQDIVKGLVLAGALTLTYLPRLKK